MWVGLAPAWNSLFLLCISLYLMELCRTQGGRCGCPIRSPRRGGKGEGGSTQRLWGAGFLLAVLGMVTLFGTKPAERLAGNGRELRAFQRQAEQVVKDMAKGVLSPEFMSKSKKVENHQPTPRDKELFLLRADRQVLTNLYLKDFQGIEYKNAGWTQDEDAFGRACRREGIDREKLQRAMAQRVFNATGYSQKTGYVIEYNGTFGNAMLMPYFTDVTDVAPGKLWGDVVLEKDPFVLRQEMQGVTYNQLSLDQVRYLSGADSDDGMEEAWDWYDGYVLDAYLDVPEEMAAVKEAAKDLGTVRAESSAADRNAERLQAAKRVAAMLSAYEYSLTLEDVPDGEDAVEYFLHTSHKGFCVHFATAGVLILREMGVPARYGAGYVVKAGEFAWEEESFLATVTGKHAHAWPEIYLDHVGWIPVEMTPGYRSSQEAGQIPYEGAENPSREETESILPETGKQSSEEGTTATPQPMEDGRENGAGGALGNDREKDGSEPSESGGENGAGGTLGNGKENGAGESGVSEPDHTQGSEGDFSDDREEQTASGSGGILALAGKLLLRAVLLLAVIAAAVFIVKNRIHAYYRIVDREIDRHCYRRAVRRINRRLYRRLRFSGALHVPHPTDKQYGDALKETFREIPEEVWDSYMCIVRQAAFSREGVTDEQAKLCRAVYHGDGSCVSRSVPLSREDV